MATQQELDKLNQIKPVQGLSAVTQQNITTNPATLGGSAQQLGQQASDNMGRPKTPDWTPETWKAFQQEKSKIQGEANINALKTGLQKTGILATGAPLGPLYAGIGAYELGKSAVEGVKNYFNPRVDLSGMPNNISTNSNNINKDTNNNQQIQQLQQKDLFQPYDPNAQINQLIRDPRQLVAPNIEYGTPDFSGNASALRDIYGNAISDPRFKTDISNVSSAIGKYMADAKGNLSKTDQEKLGMLADIRNFRQGAYETISNAYSGKDFGSALLDFAFAKGLNKRATSLQDAVNKMTAQDRANAQGAINTLQGQDITSQQQKSMQDARFTQLLGGQQAQQLAGLEDKLANFNVGVETDKINVQKDLFNKQEAENINTQNFNDKLRVLGLSQSLPSAIRDQNLATLLNNRDQALLSGDFKTERALNDVLNRIQPAKQEKKETGKLKEFEAVPGVLLSDNPAEAYQMAINAAAQYQALANSSTTVEERADYNNKAKMLLLQANSLNIKQ